MTYNQLRTNASLFLILFSTLNAIGQVSERDMEKHEKEVAKSKEKNTIIWDLDTVYNAGVPCFIMKEKSNGALQPHDFMVYSFSGQELIYMKYYFYNQPGSNPNAPTVVQYYSWYFDDTKSQCETPENIKVYKAVIENGLVTSGVINSDAEAKFVTMCGTKFSAAQAQPAPGPVVITPQQAAAGAPLASRNRNGMIQITNNQVWQDNAQVGTIQWSQSNQNGQMVDVISVYSVTNVVIAQASSITGAHNWNVVTLRDNISRIVTSTIGNDGLDVVRILIAGNYL
jgi:hypothetical protein